MPRFAPLLQAGVPVSRTAVHLLGWVHSHPLCTQGRLCLGCESSDSLLDTQSRVSGVWCGADLQLFLQGVENLFLSPGEAGVCSSSPRDESRRDTLLTTLLYQQLEQKL